MGAGHAVSITAWCWCFIRSVPGGMVEAAERPASSHARRGNIGEGSTMSCVLDQRDTPAGCAQHIKIQFHYPHLRESNSNCDWGWGGKGGWRGKIKEESAKLAATRKKV